VWDEDGTLRFEVKWLGYPNSQNTHEREENLEGAEESLQEYFKKIGGRPVQGEKKKRRRKSVVDESTPQGGKGRKKSKTEASEDSEEQEQQQQVSSQKKPKKNKGEWEPPKGSWEEGIMSIDSIEESHDPTTGEPKRWVFVMWNNGKHTRHPLQALYSKCPQKMLQYYEAHLHFRQVDHSVMSAYGQDLGTEFAPGVEPAIVDDEP